MAISVNYLTQLIFTRQQKKSFWRIFFYSTKPFSAHQKSFFLFEKSSLTPMNGCKCVFNNWENSLREKEKSLFCCLAILGVEKRTLFRQLNRGTKIDHTAAKSSKIFSFGEKVKWNKAEKNIGNHLRVVYMDCNCQTDWLHYLKKT